MLHFVLAILALGLLIFLHELGHFWVARREGMRVEAFAIGFGPPLFTWTRDGVEWRICVLPFGGYVKIAGMQREGSREPYEIADGFAAKHPIQRIRVALAGPVVNILIAALTFTVIWAFGGRDKPFAEFTHRIGWVDPDSELYLKGVRPGDWISEYDGRPFYGFRDLLIASAMDDHETQIVGFKVDDATGERTPFDYTLSTYPSAATQELLSVGVVTPARYLIVEGDLLEGSPVANTGLQVGDRILWINGERLYSMQQMSLLINESTAFLTVERNGHIFHTRVPRVAIGDLRLTAYEKGEVDDWQHEAELKKPFNELLYLPYNLAPDNRVERRLEFIDPADQERAFSPCMRCSGFVPLEEDDRILAIDGMRVTNATELLRELQTRRVLIITQRDPSALSPIVWTDADKGFDESLESNDLAALVDSIGTDSPREMVGYLHLLPAVTPKPYSELPQSAQHLEETRERIERIEDPEKREVALAELKKQEQHLLIGIQTRDREVIYNPAPWIQFRDAMVEMGQVFKGFVSGALSPKHASGPVGIVRVVQQSWSLGSKEALYWIGLISLNLGLLNLLPIPVLDGGHIVFSLFEWVTGRRLKSKTMERLIIPFVVLLIGFFLYITYHDIVRLFFKN